MNFHPHIHAIVLGGGLDVKNHWKDNGKEFFLPIKVISKIFRGKYMAELKQLWENDRLEFHGSAAPYKNYYTFKELLNTCYAKEWIPYCKKPFDGAESVIRYLGKYTHRIAISNYRIKAVSYTHLFVIVLLAISANGRVSKFRSDSGLIKYNIFKSSKGSAAFLLSKLLKSLL